MNYIELINNFWELDEHWQFTCCETRLYFYLIKTANRLGWVDNWTHSDAKAAANVGVSENSLKTARNKLIQSGLIEFKAGGKFRGDKNRYQILIPKPTPKPHPNHDPYRPPKPTPLNKHKPNKTIIPSVCPPKTEDDAQAEDERFNEIEFVDKVVAYFNSTCKNLNPVKSTTKNRRAAVLARYREHGKDAIRSTIDKAAASEFLSGQGSRNWVASFDWIFKPTNFVKTFEGNFDNKAKNDTLQQANTKPAFTSSNERNYGSMQGAKQNWYNGISDAQREFEQGLAAIGETLPDAAET